MDRSGITDPAVRASALAAASFQAGDVEEAIVIAEWFLLWIEGKVDEAGPAPVRRVVVDAEPVDLEEVGREASTHAANRRAEREAAKLGGVTG